MDGLCWPCLPMMKETRKKMEAFLLELACKLIGVTPQKKGVWVVHLAMDEDE
jgi:hypothetical protein